MPNIAIDDKLDELIKAEVEPKLRTRNKATARVELILADWVKRRREEANRKPLEVSLG